MDKKNKIIIMVSIAIFIIVILVINLLIKKYEKEPLLSVPGKTKESIPREEKAQAPQEEEKEQELEFPVEPGPLVN